jgi:hypothetical protein
MSPDLTKMFHVKHFCPIGAKNLTSLKTAARLRSCKIDRFFGAIRIGRRRPVWSSASIWHCAGCKQWNIFAPELCTKKALENQCANLVQNSCRPCENRLQLKGAVARGKRYEIFVVLGAVRRLMPRERRGKGCYRPMESGLGHFQAATALTMASMPRIFSARRRL